MKTVTYRRSELAKNSTALQYYNDWKKESDPKKAKLLRNKLDMHMEQVEQNAEDLIKRYSSPTG